MRCTVGQAADKPLGNSKVDVLSSPGEKSCWPRASLHLRWTKRLMTSTLHTRQMLWLDDLDFDLNGVQNNIYTQYVSAHFIDIEQDVDQKEWTVDDVMLP